VRHRGAAVVEGREQRSMAAHTSCRRARIRPQFGDALYLHYLLGINPHDVIVGSSSIGIERELVYM
jgi:hypothetical protein